MFIAQCLPNSLPFWKISFYSIRGHMGLSWWNVFTNKWKTSREGGWWTLTTQNKWNWTQPCDLHHGPCLMVTRSSWAFSTIQLWCWGAETYQWHLHTNPNGRLRQTRVLSPLRATTFVLARTLDGELERQALLRSWVGRRLWYTRAHAGSKTQVHHISNSNI